MGYQNKTTEKQKSRGRGECSEKGSFGFWKSATAMLGLLLLLRIIKSKLLIISIPSIPIPIPYIVCIVSFERSQLSDHQQHPAAPAARPCQARPIVGNDKTNNTNPCANLVTHISHAISVFFWVFFGFFFFSFLFLPDKKKIIFIFFKTEKQNNGKV